MRAVVMPGFAPCRIALLHVMPGMVHVIHPALARLAGIVDGGFDLDLSGLFERQRQRELVSVLQRAGQAHQHDVIATTGEFMHLSGRQRDPTLNLDHLHHTIGAFDMGVQLGLLRHIRRNGDEAVIGFGVVVDHEEDRATAAHGPVAAGIDVVDVEAFGVLLRKGRGGKHQRQRGGGREKSYEAVRVLWSV